MSTPDFDSDTATMRLWAILERSPQLDMDTRWKAIEAALVDVYQQGREEPCQNCALSRSEAAELYQRWKVHVEATR